MLCEDEAARCQSPCTETLIPFQPITAGAAAALRPYLNEQPFRTCDYTVGAIYQWRAYFNTYYAIEAGMLVQIADYPGEGICYAYPVGDGDMDRALAAIERDARARRLRLVYCCVPEEGVPVLRARYGLRADVSSHRDWADYLYLADNLKTFPGKKYHGQKNHLNRFVKENPDYRYVPVTEQTLPAALRFLDEYEKYAPIDKVIEVEEMARSKELLRHSLTLGMTAGFIETAGTIVALSVGEVVGDTLYVHVEKARLDFAGAYQAIVSEYAKAACRPDTLYINREDDSGEEGLRRSKLSYQPQRLIDKYWVTVARR